MPYSYKISQNISNMNIIGIFLFKTFQLLQYIYIYIYKLQCAYTIYKIPNYLFPPIYKMKPEYIYKTSHIVTINRTSKHIPVQQAAPAYHEPFENQFINTINVKRYSYITCFPYPNAPPPKNPNSTRTLNFTPFYWQFWAQTT